MSVEHTLPQIKPADRRREVQAELSRNRQVLNALRRKLDDIVRDAELKKTLSTGDQAAVSGLDEEGMEGDLSSGEENAEDLLGAAEEWLGSTSDSALPGTHVTSDGEQEERDGNDEGDQLAPLDSSRALPTATAITTATPTGIQPAAIVTTSSSLRNRHHRDQSGSRPATAEPTTGTSMQDTERDLASHRQEQDTLTASLVTLATQLKTSTQDFHTTLESEKSVLDRAVDGLDRTTMSMASTERRMGMLRRMTEGKGWWGRMLLYAWIFALWFVALAIVFLGPKLR